MAGLPRELRRRLAAGRREAAGALQRLDRDCDGPTRNASPTKRFETLLRRNASLRFSVETLLSLLFVCHCLFPQCVSVSTAGVSPPAGVVTGAQFKDALALVPQPFLPPHAAVSIPARRTLHSP